MDTPGAPPQPTIEDRRLWTPWRMSYVGGGTREVGCVFCNRLHADQDVASLILHRAANAFIIMNLFPYNTGHVMIVPNAHLDSPERASPEEITEMAALVPPVLRAARRVLACHGFNIGINVGSVAGAGVAEHLHEHIVPRWNGDANFMPILGSAMVMPELIPVTYAKLRAELTRELNQAESVTAIIVDAAREHFGRFENAWQPSFPLDAGQAVWQTLLASIPGTAVAGWAGETRATSSAPPLLTLTAPQMTSVISWTPIADAMATMPPAERKVAERALANLAPTFVLSNL